MIKVLVLDFDDTLYIHDPFEVSNISYVDRIVLGLKTDKAYIKSRMTPSMRELIKTALNHGIPIYGLTWATSSLMMEVKQKQVNMDFGPGKIKMCSSGSAESKLTTLEVIQKMNDCTASDVLLIDDLYSTNELVRKNGFKAACPQAIDAFGIDYILGITKDDLIPVVSPKISENENQCPQPRVKRTLPVLN